MCTKLECRTNINLSKSNFDRICDDVGITSSPSPINAKRMRAMIIYNFYNLQLSRVCSSCQTVQTLTRCCLSQHLIWVYAVCKCSFFACIQPDPQVCTLNFRLATRLDSNGMANIIWATTQENLSSGFPTKPDSIKSTWLQRLARKLKLHLQQA